MTMAQEQAHDEQPTHPFDMPKSEFEKLLDRDFRVEDIRHAQEEAAYAQTLTDHFTRSVWMARAIDNLRQLLTDELMDLVVMPLMNTKLGFKTDRPNKRETQPYPREEVREAVIEALIRGAYITGNEFNIISKSAYLTKDFFRRKLAEHEGFTDFVPLPGVPRIREGGAVVPYTCSWKLKGQPTSITREIVVKVNDMMGADAIIGKADRKMWATVYQIITGSQQSFPEGDVDDTETTYFSPGAAPVNTRLQQLMPAIENGKNGNGNHAAPQHPAANPPAPPPATPTTQAPATDPAPVMMGTPVAQRQRRTGGRPGPQQQKPAENKPADPPAAPQPAATVPAKEQNPWPGYKTFPLPAGVPGVDWLQLKDLDAVYEAYNGLSDAHRKIHWAHVTPEVQETIAAACKHAREKQTKQDTTADAPAPAPAAGGEPAKGVDADEAQEFVDSKSVDQLKAWFLRMNDDLRKHGCEAAGVANLTEANEQQIRVAAVAMRRKQTGK